MIKHHAYLHNLTPLRGLAALWVVVFHFKGSILLFSHVPWTRAMDKGYMMVDLFFIMSGFIIRHVYAESFRQQMSMHDTRKFFIARIARIYPLHLFTLFLLVAIVWWQDDWNIVNDPAAIPTNMLMLHSFGIHKIYTWNRHSWRGSGRRSWRRRSGAAQSSLPSTKVKGGGPAPHRTAARVATGFPQPRRASRSISITGPLPRTGS